MYGFARYGLPTDDLLARLTSTVITVTGGSPSEEDPDYPITNWLARRPSKPSKLLSTTGGWLFDFGGAANIAAFALIYHNFDEGQHVLLEWSANNFSTTAGSQAITIPAWTEDGWSVSPWIEVTGSPTYQYWRLTVSGSPGNSYPLSLGRPVFLGALRDPGNDVRFGVVRSEAHQIVEMATALEVETIYALGGKRGTISGEAAFRNEVPNEDAQKFISLVRSAAGRTLPWLLIPDLTVNEAWMVRFVDSGFDNTQEMINHNIFPFRVRELSRGLPWPGPVV